MNVYLLVHTERELLFEGMRELVLNPRSKQNSDPYIHITNSAPM